MVSLGLLYGVAGVLIVLGLVLTGLAAKDLQDYKNFEVSCNNHYQQQFQEFCLANALYEPIVFNGSLSVKKQGVDN